MKKVIFSMVILSVLFTACGLGGNNPEATSTDSTSVAVDSNCVDTTCVDTTCVDSIK